MPVSGHIRIRVMLGDETAFGPGKADLLEAIRREGSISAAAKTMGMSYRRAWLLVDTMNRCFSPPLVEAAKGGAGGGGATVSETGLALLSAFRAMHDEVSRVVNANLASFETCARTPGARQRRQPVGR